MKKVISIANQKGGVGKTTTTLNLAAGLVQKGRRTLVIDYDPQKNLSDYLGFEPDGGITIADLMLSGAQGNPLDPSEAIRVNKEGIDFIPSNIMLSSADMFLSQAMFREQTLKNVLASSAFDSYEYILIDCLPSLGVLLTNALKLIQDRAISEVMFKLLLLAIRHGVPICISGETGAGKTTLAGCLLAIASQTMRIFTIEEGSREWNFVTKDEHGRPINSVIHTRTRPNEDNPSLSIDQEALVVLSLRFDPQIIAPGEIRGKEAYETMSVANTGHTVVTTIHSNSTEDTPRRMVGLAKKAHDMSDNTLYDMAASAFPILVHTEKLSDDKRRITEIREVTGFEGGKVQSKMLFEFEIEDNLYEGERCVDVVGEFVQQNPISPELAKRLLKKGARRSEIAPYMHCEGGR